MAFGMLFPTLLLLIGDLRTLALRATPQLNFRPIFGRKMLGSIRIHSPTSPFTTFRSTVSSTKQYLAADQTSESVEASSGVNYYTIDSSDQAVGFGDFSLIASQEETGRHFAQFESLGKEGGPKDGDVVWIRGRVSSVRAKGNACFMVIRSGAFNTVQACHFKDKENPDESKKMIKYVGGLTLESIVDIMGVVVAADVKSCSVSNVELQIKRIYTVRITFVNCIFLNHLHISHY